MQQAALDSISKTLKFTGTPFSAVSSSFRFNHPTQSKQNKFHTVLSACRGFQRAYGFAFVVARCVRRAGANEQRHCVSKKLFRAVEMVNFLNNKCHLNPRCRYQTGGALLGEVWGIGERLWLMLEVKHGLKVQVQ